MREVPIGDAMSVGRDGWIGRRSPKHSVAEEHGSCIATSSRNIISLAEAPKKRIRDSSADDGFAHATGTYGLAQTCSRAGDGAPVDTRSDFFRSASCSTKC